MEIDKTTLRIILAALGVLLLLGIYLWDRIKRKRFKLKTSSELEAEPAEEIDTISLNPLEETLPVDPDVLEAEESIAAPEKAREEISPSLTESKTRSLPEVIQVSVVAPPGQMFSGDQLLEAFKELKLQYGEMEIFHCLEGEEIQFSVASLIKPGTFPIEAMEEFQTRGLTLFFQPPLVSNPEEAFERMISACHALAKRLGGSELDDRRQPLTPVKISLWRRQLKQA
jgi:cell division protein ZipA